MMQENVWTLPSEEHIRSRLKMLHELTPDAIGAMLETELVSYDPDKADEMLEAFKKGYKQAEEAWGGELPEISQKTYDAVLEKFDAWKKEAAEAES